MIYVLQTTNPCHPDGWGIPTSVRLIGPHVSIDAAMRWCDDPAHRPHGRYSWEVVDLDDARAPVVSLDAWVQA